jgi:hypothetical protein
VGLRASLDAVWQFKVSVIVIVIFLSFGFSVKYMPTKASGFVARVGNNILVHDVVLFFLRIKPHLSLLGSKDSIDLTHRPDDH